MVPVRLSVLRYPHGPRWDPFTIFVMHRSLLAPALGILFLSVSPNAQIGTVTTLPGECWDLTASSQGDLLFVTNLGVYGRLTTNGATTVVDTLTNGGTPPLPLQLRAVSEGTNGDVFVMYDDGWIYRSPGGSAQLVEHYNDVWMILDATDMVMDQDGNFLIASRTPSNGQRGLNWVSADGLRWAYYAVEDQPIGLAADPVTGNVFMTDQSANGTLRQIDVGDPSHDTSIVNQTPWFFSTMDGDIVVQQDGDAFILSGGSVWEYDRTTGQTSVFAQLTGQLSALAIASSSGSVPSASGYSLYVAEGANPATIKEIGNVDAPASDTASFLGAPPGQGEYVTFYGPLTAMDLNVDRDGEILVSGDRWGANFAVRRFDRASGTVSLIANEAQGISGKVEGISVDQDGTIWGVTSQGNVHAIRENPLSVSDVYIDNADVITQGKDISLGRDGTIYIADRECFGCGEVRTIDPITGQTAQLTPVNECKSVSVDAFNSQLLVSEWNGTGFNGTVNECDPLTGQMTPLPGFEFINYSNEAVRGDGDALMDVFGRIYTCSYDDWRVTRWDPTTNRYSIVGSMYLRVVVGLAISGSRPGTTSGTGWSLYVSDNDNLWEIPNVVPPTPQRVDPDAPGIGDLLGFLDGRMARPRAMIADPAGGGLLITTKGGEVVRMDTATGQTTLLADSSNGLTGDLTAIAARPDGKILVAAIDGRIWRLDPQNAWSVSVEYTGAGFNDVRGMTVDAANGIVLIDRITPSSEASRVVRLDTSGADVLTYSARGARPAIDPLTAEVWVSQRGTSRETGGQILRIDQSLNLARVGNYHPGEYRAFGVGEYDGGLTFSQAGDVYVCAGREGRVYETDRSTGVSTILAGNYEDPVAVALASGRSGIAGQQGTSAFVLDGWVVWETGVDGLPAGPAPSSNPGLGDDPDMWLTGLAGVGTSHQIRILEPAEASQLYLILPTFFGKEPGFPLFLLEPGDPRTIANNFHPWWNLVVTGSAFQDFLSILDPFGRNPQTTGVQLPPSASILTAEQFVDFAWISLQPGNPQPVDYVGGNTQIYLGL